jgi:hypothetical protein
LNVSDGVVRRLEGTPQSMPVSGVESILQALDEVLPMPQQRGWHRVRVLLGPPYAQCALLPWQPSAGPQAWLGAARERFAGTGMAGSRIAMEPLRWRRDRLAVAGPEALCAGIARLCKARKRHLQHIVPTFVHALNQHRRRIRDGSVALIVLEGRYAQIGLRHDQAWQGHVSLPYRHDVPLKPLLRDASMLIGRLLPERCYVMSANSLPASSLDSLPDATWLETPWLLASLGGQSA